MQRTVGGLFAGVQALCEVGDGLVDQGLIDEAKALAGH
jgi:hypothetical protein